MIRLAAPKRSWPSIAVAKPVEGVADGSSHVLFCGAELLFQIITEREESASIACASNAPFSEWGTTFTDPRLAAAIVDGLTFNAHIINTGTTSYRLRATRAKQKRAATT